MDEPPERATATVSTPGNTESTPAFNPPSGEPHSIGNAQLHIIPVDPHRVFAHWFVAPEVVAQLRAAERESAGGVLALRIMKVEPDDLGNRNISPREDFPVDAGWHDSFFSLTKPGGTVAASLGFKGRGDEFSPFVTSLPVTLPEAPAMPPPPPPRQIAPTPPDPSPIVAPPPPPPRRSPVSASATDALEERDSPVRALPSVSPQLDEAAVLAAALNFEDLPQELRTVPLRSEANGAQPAVAPPAVSAPFDMGLEHGHSNVALAAPPQTPALDEREVIVAALRALLPPEFDGQAGGDGPQVWPPPALTEAVRGPVEARTREIPGESKIPSSPSSAPAPSSLRLASHWANAQEPIPFFLRAKLVLSGQVPAGCRLRIGGRDVPPVDDGRFVYEQPIESFHTAWALLERSLGTPWASGSLLSVLASSEAAPIPLRSEVEIEGGINDPSYYNLIPGGIGLDAAGRFRLIRPLPANVVPLPLVELVTA